MKEGKWHSKHWRAAHLLTILTGAVLVAVFFQSWRVYAFDAGQAVASAASAAGPPVPSIVSAVTLMKAPDLVASAAKPERWSDSEVVSALSNFYQSIITYMGLLLGVVGLLSVITLRFLSKAAAEDMAHDSAKDAMKHYLDTGKFTEVVGYAVQEAIQETDIVKQLEQLAIEKTAIAKQIEQLAAEVASVKQMVKEQTVQAASAPTTDDHDDDEDVEGVVGPLTDPPGGAN